MARKLVEIYNVGAVYLVPGGSLYQARGRGTEEGPFWSAKGSIPSKGVGIDETPQCWGFWLVILPSDSVVARHLGDRDGSRRGITLMT